MLLRTLFLSLALLLSCSLTAQYSLTGTISGDGGSTGSFIIVIDETVCLAAGTCSGTTGLGITSFDLTIDNGCRAGSYSFSDFAQFIISSNGVPDLTMDLIPQLNDFNIIISVDQPNGFVATAPFIFTGFQGGTACEQFTMQAMIPAPVVAACSASNGTFSIN